MINKGNKGNLQENRPLFCEDEINPNLQLDNLTLGHLKVDIILRFGSYVRAGQKVNLSAQRTKQILNGHILPKSSELIKRIAEGWGLDPVGLTLLFDKYRK